jgi:glutamate synthase domain-containing protein 2
LDGSYVNRKVGAVRAVGSSTGLTRTQAERMLRKLQEEEERRPRRQADHERITVAHACDSLRRELAVSGARKAYLEGCESMQRIHIAPRIGDLDLDAVTREHIEALAGAMLKANRAPKTVRNVLTFTYSVFEHAIDRG